MDSRKEGRLVADACAGDARAFEQLSRAHDTRLRARIDRMLKGRIRRKIAVDDVLQETFLAAFRRLPDFELRGEGAFGAWLGRIAELKVLEAQGRFFRVDKRSIDRELPQSAGPVLPGLEARGPNPSQVAAAHDDERAVRDALDHLPPDYRRVLVLIHVDGLTIEQAAACVDRSVAATRKLYGRGLRRLARAFPVKESSPSMA